MKRPLNARVLIVDDDPTILELLRARISCSFPELSIICRTNPDASGDFDIYLLDNDFEGSRLAHDLASVIRAAQPDSLIIAFSGALDSPTLKGLINAGCAGAFEKRDPRDFGRMLTCMREFLDKRTAAARRKKGPIELWREITQLIRAWNQRLAIQERQAG